MTQYSVHKQVLFRTFQWTRYRMDIFIFYYLKIYCFKYNQQDAMLYNILYFCQCSICVRWFLRPSSGTQNSTHSIWYTSSLLAATASVGELELTHASGSSKQVWYITDAVCKVLSSCWWAEKPRETCRALTAIKKIVKRCNLLVKLKGIHDPINVKFT